jgi:hypothetical protein
MVSIQQTIIGSNFIQDYGEERDDSIITITRRFIWLAFLRMKPGAIGRA